MGNAKNPNPKQSSEATTRIRFRFVGTGSITTILEVANGAVEQLGTGAWNLPWWNLGRRVLSCSMLVSKETSTPSNTRNGLKGREESSRRRVEKTISILFWTFNFHLLVLRALVKKIKLWKLWSLSTQSLSNHCDESNSSSCFKPFLSYHFLTYKLCVLTFNDLRCHWQQLTVDAVPENNVKGSEKSTEEYLWHFKKKGQTPILGLKAQSLKAHCRAVTHVETIRSNLQKTLWTLWLIIW